jgi:subtilisin-like proprotein convertase family protein
MKMKKLSFLAGLFVILVSYMMISCSPGVIEKPKSEDNIPDDDIEIYAKGSMLVTDESQGVFRVFFEDQVGLAELAKHYDIWEIQHDQGYALVALGATEKKKLSATGMRLEIDQAQTLNMMGANMLGPSGYPCYRDVDTLYADMYEIEQNYSHLVDVVDYGDSYYKVNGLGGHDLLALHISKESSDSTEKPVFFLMATIHARELTTPETAMYFADWLLSGYGTNPEATWLIDNRDIWIAPMVNPDGRQLCEQGCWQRKNRNNEVGNCAECDSAGFSQQGVDLNRNYAWDWGGAGTDACEQTYQGTSAASEPETYYLVDLIKSIIPDQRPDDQSSPAPATAQGVLITLHSYSNLVLWPWGNTYDAAPNGTALQTLGRKFAWFNNYEPSQSVDLYPTTGATDDWSYGELGIASYTFELGETFFQNCSDLPQIMEENLGAFIYAAKVADRPYLTPMGPDVVDLAVVPSIVTPGTQVEIQASIDDTRFNNQNGIEPSQVIQTVGYTIDQLPTTAGVNLIPMQALDGTFDESVEAVVARFDTSSIDSGMHTIYVVGTDADGNQGAIWAASLYVGDNNIPVANAGLDQQVDEMIPVTLDGSQSYDLDGDDLTFNWDQTGGPEVILSDASTMQPTFMAPDIDGQISLTFSLRVSDGQFMSEADTVQITVIANSNWDVEITSSDTPIAVPDTSEIASVINVSESRPITSFEIEVAITHTYIGDLVISIMAPSGEEIVLQRNEGGSTNDLHEIYQIFDFNDLNPAGDWTLRIQDIWGGDSGTLDFWVLRMDVDPDGHNGLEPGDLIVTEVMPNPQSGSGDPENEWFEILNTTNQDINLLGVQFSDSEATYTVDQDITITAGEYLVFAHSAASDLGFDPDGFYGSVNIFLANSGDQVMIIAPNGTEIDRVDWSQSGMPSIVAGISIEREANLSGWCRSQAAAFNAAGEKGTPQAASSCAGSGNQAPVAEAGSDQSVQSGEDVILDGSQSYDPDNDLISYEWIQTLGTPVTLFDADTEHPSFTAPTVSVLETLTFSLVVSDDQFVSEADTVDITVQADASGLQPGDLLVTEVMPNPQSGSRDPENEWFEILNTTNQDINLLGVQFSDSEATYTVDQDMTIASGEYLVFAHSAASDLGFDPDGFYGSVNIILANSGDQVMIIAPNGTEIDRVDWSQSDMPYIVAGISIEREANLSGWCRSEAAAFNAAGEKGTPQAASSCAGSGGSGDGEDCSGPLAIHSGTFNGTTNDASADASGTCAGNGPDRVYQFTLEAATRVSFESSGYDTVLHLRSSCDDQTSQIDCDDDGGYNYGSLLSAELAEGTYYLWMDSYSSGGAYNLEAVFQTNPCSDDEAACPGESVCLPSNDWASYTCECPAGSVPHEGECIDDPCDPNPCTEDNKNQCVHDLPGYSCECNSGYISDANGNCVVDPNANKWAVIVFLNADNNLDEYGVEDVAEMGVAGSDDYVRIVVLFDRYSDTAKKIYITEGGYTELADDGELNMSEGVTLSDFGIWAVENYPAQKYAFIMWNHGGGWQLDNELGRNSLTVEDAPLFKGFSNDDHPGGGEISISSGEYATAMEAITDALGRKLDIIGFDACLMGMWEVNEASAPYGNYLVASSDVEPAIGWPYDDFLVPLKNNNDMSPLELASEIVDAYHNESSNDATLSVVDLDTMDDLAVRMTEFADALRSHPELFSSIENVRSQTQQFYSFDEFRDLKDFAERIQNMSGVTSDIQDAAVELCNQLDITIAYNRAQSTHPGANGISIYFPSRGSWLDSRYSAAGAVWSQRTTWDDFLADFTEY